MSHVTLFTRRGLNCLVPAVTSLCTTIHPQHWDAAATTLHHVQRRSRKRQHNPRTRQHEGEDGWGREPPPDATTRRGGWVGMRTHVRQQQGDGYDDPSPQKVHFFFGYYIVYKYWHPLFPFIAIFVHPMRHSTTPSLPAENVKCAPESTFYVFSWYSSTQPFPPVPTNPRHDNTKGRPGGDENVNVQQKQGWGWAIVPILTKDSFFFVITSYISSNTHPLPL